MTKIAESHQNVPVTRTHGIEYKHVDPVPSLLFKSLICTSDIDENVEDTVQIQNPESCVDVGEEPVMSETIQQVRPNRKVELNTVMFLEPHSILV
jgi:hypothetical protein